VLPSGYVLPGQSALLDRMRLVGKNGSMEMTVPIPDAIASLLQAEGGDLSRRALEALALEEYKSGRLTNAELRQMLGYTTLAQIDGFLKDRGVFHDYTMEDPEQDRAALRDTGQ
jgi:hypothetical protein